MLNITHTGNPTVAQQYHESQVSGVPQGTTQVITRVMSPTPNSQLALQSCDICRFSVRDVWVCSSCYVAGHPQCLQATALDGYAFCKECIPGAVAQHTRMRSEEQRALWSRRLAAQLANWQSMSVAATGALGSAGIAIGGAGAILIGGTGALVQGAIKGVRATTPPPPQPIEDEPREAAMVRVPATDDDLVNHGPPASRRHGIVGGSSRLRARSAEEPRVVGVGFRNLAARIQRIIEARVGEHA